MYIFILALLIIVFYYYLFSRKENFVNTIYKLPKNYKLQYKDCLLKCSERDCLKMFHQKKILDKCNECQNKGMCFNKLVIDGVCDICNKDSKKINCSSIFKYGCKNPDNILNFQGSSPYYIMVKSNNPNYAYDTECKFCWNL